MKINGVAKGQYKQLCRRSWERCNGNEKLLEHKIKRAVDLCKETYKYSNGCRIVRYYYLNFLVSDDEAMTMWEDKTRPEVKVDKKLKEQYKENSFKGKGILKKLIYNIMKNKKISFN